MFHWKSGEWPAAALRPHFVRWNPGKSVCPSGLGTLPSFHQSRTMKKPKKPNDKVKHRFKICFPHVCNCLQSLGTLTSKLQKAQGLCLGSWTSETPLGQLKTSANSTYQPSLGSLWASQLEDIHLTQLNTEVHANQRTEPFQLGTFSAKTWNERSWKRPQLNAKTDWMQASAMPSYAQSHKK